MRIGSFSEVLILGFSFDFYSHLIVIREESISGEALLQSFSASSITTQSNSHDLF